MRRPIETYEELPGRTPVAWRRSGVATLLAALAAIAWPPLVLTLPFWPPGNWAPGLDIDPRLFLLAVGAVAVPLGLWRLRRESARTGRPSTRLGVVWRFILYGGLLAGAIQVVVALVIAIDGTIGSSDIGQAAGFMETALLIYGVAGLPVVMLTGISYAVWAGLCVAFIAFRKAPEPVNDRLGLMRGR